VDRHADPREGVEGKRACAGYRRRDGELREPPAGKGAKDDERVVPLEVAARDVSAGPFSLREARRQDSGHLSNIDQRTCTTVHSERQHAS